MKIKEVIVTFCALSLIGFGGIFVGDSLRVPVIEPPVKPLTIPVCGNFATGTVRCLSEVVIDPISLTSATSSPVGYGPAQFLGAYGLTGITATNTTIGIVAYSYHPYILHDVNEYSDVFGIQRLNDCSVDAGSTSTPCFEAINENGAVPTSPINPNWSLEISLDVEVAHAVCQNCNILLCESKSAAWGHMFSCIDRLRERGVKIISNSWAGPESPALVGYDTYLNYPGISFLFSSGDWNYGVYYPASSPYALAVGGTTLYLTDHGGGVYSRATEYVWNHAGSGCSVYSAQQSWQTDLGLSGCSNRIVADVSAVANPATGAAVYDSIMYLRQKGWRVVGGTSLSTPLIAGVQALAGVPDPEVMANSVPYYSKTSENLYDITSGANGSCSPSYLCTGVAGYDGPSGLGTPNGYTAFK
jgi:subtilase family serine protease